MGSGESEEPPGGPWALAGCGLAAVTGPADVAMSRRASPGSVTCLRASDVKAMLLRRRPIVGARGAELVRCEAPREDLPPDDADVVARCLLVEYESRSVIEKERLGRVASSETSREGCRRAASRALLALALAWASVLVAITAVMLSGVPGLLMKYTLSPSSLVDSSASAPAESDCASTSVGLCLPSGTILRNPSTFDKLRSFATRAVK
jgi:hypothetical protein